MGTTSKCCDVGYGRMSNVLLKRNFAYQNKIPEGTIKTFEMNSSIRMLWKSENTVKPGSAMYNTELK